MLFIRYDVYTPTRNIVYHEYSPPEGVEPRGYPRLEQLRRAAVIRIKTLLQLKGGKETEIDQANLGLYGLGERRSLSALESFVGIVIAKRSADFKNKVSLNESQSILSSLFRKPVMFTVTVYYSINIVSVGAKSGCLMTYLCHR